MKIQGKSVLITVNNDDQNAWFNLPDMGWGVYEGVLSGRRIQSDNGRLSMELEASSGEIWVRV